MMWQILSLPWENVEQDDYIWKIAIKIFLCEKMSSALSNVKKVCDLHKKRRLREAIKKIANFCPPTTFLSKFSWYLIKIIPVLKEWVLFYLETLNSYKQILPGKW
jgi:hypothetical protein